MMGLITPRQPIIVASHAAVATDDERCSQIALKVLKGDGFPKPGNAVDAAVAASLSLGVVSLACSGIGGGAFMLLRLADGKTEAFDMRECSHKFDFERMANMVKTNVIPNMANVIPDMANVIRNAANLWEAVKALILKAVQALSIGVPGELAGLYKAWEEYGSLPWEDLVKPAMNLAYGFEISDYVHYEMCLLESEIKADEGLREILTRDGKLLNKGEICRNEKLGETLKKISKEGIKPFYEGKIGEALIEDIEKLGGKVAKLVGGSISMTDMRSYKAKKRDPIKAKISEELEFIGMPPPSAGGAGIALMVKILKQYGGNLDLSSNIGIHRKIEAFKHVLAMTLNIGDPDFVDCSKVICDMLSDNFAKELKETIDDNKTLGVCRYGGRWNEIYKIPTIEHGTSHFSIVDKAGNAVAMTCSLNNHFGAKFRSRKTGIVLNDQMYDFSIPFVKVCPNNREPGNFIAPGKRPLSSMSPTIILKNGKLNAVVGGAGGLLIIPGVAEVILNYYFKKMDELNSVVDPRCYPRMQPNEVYYENFTTVTNYPIEVPEETRKSLKEKGHVLKDLDSGAVCNIITIKELRRDTKNCVPNNNKQIVAVSDPRKGGVPAGD